MSSEFPPPDSTGSTPQPWLTSDQYADNRPSSVPSIDLREWLLPLFLFLATALSTTYAGLLYVPEDFGFLAILRHPVLLLRGVPFSFTLLTILAAHEMGHFLACRYYGIRCTPPFFIPFPVTYAGTLGAFIRIKSHFQHRRALFDVGVAGPIAGFAFIIPALIVGIAWSRLIPKVNVHGVINFGEPLLFRLLGMIILGYSPDRQDIVAHPIAMAAWFGLLATSLNLFPIWQLDGGHISYAILGKTRQRQWSIAATVALMMVSLAGWPIPSYLFFACLLLAFGLRFRFYHPPTLLDDEPLGTGRVLLGIVAFVILILSFTPVPVYLS